MKIYLTHCSSKKDNSIKNTGRKVTPDKLYMATPTQRFMRKCSEKKVNWAIFSDLYGVWFLNEERGWYEKSPDAVTEQEFKVLINNFDDKLKQYDEIWFYYNPGRFHRLYKRLLQETKLKERIKRFTHIGEIG
jgi:hypothetical protein